MAAMDGNTKLDVSIRCDLSECIPEVCSLRLRHSEPGEYDSIDTFLTYLTCSTFDILYYVQQMYDDVAYAVDPQHVEGEMTVGTKERSSTLGEPEFNTLDEPIRDTIVRGLYLFTISALQNYKVYFIFVYVHFYLIQLRDVRAVGKKFFHVLCPKEKKSLLKECESTNDRTLLLRRQLIIIFICFRGSMGAINIMYFHGNVRYLRRYKNNLYVYVNVIYNCFI